ncbi:MAG TPA: hypothetical protein VF159_09710 [Gemmatimonadaceae bacterium]
MSYVCLWSPTWPTAADFPADLVAAFLAHAPRVAVGDERRVWADARGLPAGNLAEQLLAVASEHGWDDVHAGAATTPVAAEVAATCGTSPLVVVKPGTDRQFIAPHPFRVLSPSDQLTSLLDGLGLVTCGSLAALEAEQIEVRLGLEGVRLWEKARAEDERWLFRIPPRALPSASIEWVEYGLRDPERLLFIINSLAGTVCASLIESGARAREMTLVFFLGTRQQRTHAVRSSRPSAEQKRWTRLMREALDSITLPEAVTGLALRVESVTGNDGAQGDLFDRGFATQGAVDDALLQLTDDQGDVVVDPVNSAHPLIEARTAWKPTTEARAPRASVADVQAALRLQLLPTVRTVSVQTQPRRDHEVPIHYDDGDGSYDIIEAAGPERVSGGTWSTTGPYAREYFRCVREDGTMVWLYRSRGESAWYLQGWWD